MSGRYTLYGRTGWGSALIEAQLAWYGLPFDLVEVGNLFTDEAARASLARVNPLAQVPTLVLPNGAIVTESAAITLLLADLDSAGSLVPPPGDAARGAFLRWLVFLVANIYPTFTYADDPARFVAVETARDPFRAATEAYAQRLWRTVASAAGAPWFLGERFSALDIYVAVMTRWRPRRAWFDTEAPHLAAIAARVDAEPIVAAVWARNFPKG